MSSLPLASTPESRMRDTLERRFAQTAPHHGAMVTAMAEACLVRRPGQAKIAIVPATNGQPALLVVVNDDMPYLLDTTLLCLKRSKCRTARVLHPIVTVKRDIDGVARALGGNRADSVICVELPDGPAPGLADMLADSLKCVAATIGAEPAIRHQMAGLAQAISDSAWELKAFVSWLMEGHFLPLGLSLWREMPGASPQASQVFGLSQHHEWPDLGELARAGFADAAPPLSVTRLPRNSPIVRDILFDAIVLRVEDGDHRKVAVLVGLFDPPLASVAAREIPYLRRKVSRTIELAGVVPLSHDEKHLRRIVEVMPRASLFMDGVETILDRARTILEREEHALPCCFASPLPGGTLTLAQVLLAKERFHPGLEDALKALMERHLGEQVSGIVRGDGISWTIGRQRGGPSVS